MCFLLVTNDDVLLNIIGLAGSYNLNKTAHGCIEIDRNLLRNTDLSH